MDIGQKVPFSLEQWTHLEAATRSTSGVSQHILATWLLLLGGVVRFAHVQRTYKDLISFSVGGVALWGKTKQDEFRSTGQPRLRFCQAFVVFAHFCSMP